MPELITSPRGTQDVLPEYSYRWQYIERALQEVCRRFGYKEVRVPTFEHTELFARGVGDTTDVVGKEMYTMTDKGGRSITLRPEGTSGVARAFMQSGILSGTLPVRAFYIMSCFRYEKPQAGRLREFHQLGIELYGSSEPDADCEVIRVASSALSGFGLKKVRLEINSIGCPDCRPIYRKALYDYFSLRRSELCETCRDRLERNPMRIIDCKSPTCQSVASGAPIALDYLCEDCSGHFEKLKALLDETNIAYTVNPRIVRGLDYYTKTVFEFVHEGAGAQGTVCGGGRYDGLVGELGGQPTPGVGFGMGMERLLGVLDSEGIEAPRPCGPELFIAYLGALGEKKSREFVNRLQDMGIFAMRDINARSLKAQLKFADKQHAKFLAVIGDDEVAKGIVTVKNMAGGGSFECGLDAAQLAAAIGKN
ncbi:MAG: histidine--tRNA ligase [Oscillospiraceae bacterium]